MRDVRSRLIRCFSAVFPGLSEEDIVRASTSSVDSWDSLAALNLLLVIEQEFATQIPSEDLGRLVSFDRILDYFTQSQVGSSRS